MPQGYIFGVRYVRSAATIANNGALRNATFSGTAGGLQDFENSSVQLTGGYIFGHAQSRGRRRH